MEESSEESYPASAVFNNQILVQTILEHVTNDIRNNMSFRLVNRTFRNSCHAMLRKNHRKVKIEFVSEYYEEARREYNEIHIYVNYRPVKFSNVDNYFHLVKNIANVKVDSIYVKNLFLLTEKKQNTLHDSITRTLIGNDREIIETLIGMEEICYSGCEDCTRIPRKCLEYGPIRIKNLRESFAEPHFFEKLIITDYFLDNIANACVKSSKTKEECMNAVENLVNSNVTCKTLVLKIPESWKKDINDISLLNKLKPMPREVLEILLKKWRVQSLRNGELRDILENCSVLTPDDCRSFVERWMNSDDTEVKSFCLHWGYDLPANFNLDGLGLEIKEFNPVTRSHAYLVTHDFAYDVSVGQDFVRKDGVLASVMIFENIFFFCAWHERFHDLDGVEVHEF